MIFIPHLETDVTQACQLSCVACNHSVPLWRKHGPWTADPKQISEDLSKLSTMVHATRWGALGGEPLLHRELIKILKIARDSGVADKYEVWTNGLLLKKQPPEFWSSFDILVLSIYPGKLTEDDISWITDRCDSAQVQLDIKDERKHPNFKTMLEPVPTSGEATVDKYNRCFFKNFSRVANYGFFFTCCCAPHLPMLVQGKTFGIDGVLIATASEESINDYLTSKSPLGACDICAGRDTAVDIPWSEERNPITWLRKSAGASE